MASVQGPEDWLQLPRLSLECRAFLGIQMEPLNLVPLGLGLTSGKVDDR